jgi:hypothetical protein
MKTDYTFYPSPLNSFSARAFILPGAHANVIFLIDGEDGAISGRNPAVDSSHAIIAADNSSSTIAVSSVYNICTLGSRGTNRLSPSSNKIPPN